MGLRRRIHRDGFAFGETLLVALNFYILIAEKGEKNLARFGGDLRVNQQNQTHAMKNHTVCSFQKSPCFLNPITLSRSLCWAAVIFTALGLSPASRAADGDLGNGNTAEGNAAHGNLTTGGNNTALGNVAMFNNKDGGANTATGSGALYTNVSGFSNTADGFAALISNTASFNTATGSLALNSNTSGSDNTAVGYQALKSKTTGPFHTPVGESALLSNTTGDRNTATGNGNTATGFNALLGNTTGNNNTAVGFSAGQNLTVGANNIDIGANVLGNAGEANTIRIGKQGTQKSTLIAGIFGTAVTGSSVVVSSTGKLGVATSSARFKEAIKPMDDASAAVLKLKTVTFRH